MEKKLDFLGNELNLGDEIVFMEVKYRNLMKGTIIKIADKKCTISHEKINSYKTETMQFYGQLILSKKKSCICVNCEKEKAVICDSCVSSIASSISDSMF